MGNERDSRKLYQRGMVLFMGTALLLGMIGGCEWFFLRQTRPALEQEYVLYIGLNDQDTYKQLIPTIEAREIISELCVQYVEGYTVTEAEGAWVDEQGRLTTEHTLIYSFRNAGEEEIFHIMDEVLEVLNQNTILLERRYSTWVYYGGADES